MANGRLLKQLARFGAEGDLSAFRQAFAEIIQDERSKHHNQLANDLETILKGRVRNEPIPIRRTLEVPTDRESGMPLCEVREPARDLDDLVLSDQNADLVGRLLREYEKEAVLRAHDLRPSARVLFYGPPGCGKSATAEVLATELARPLVIVRTDAVITSLLGETATNLRKVFEFLDKLSAVALFDEFDALSRERADTNDHGELKRVVNTLLQMMSDYRGRSLIIATTNIETSLDPAMWRRFEEVLFFDVPTLAQIEALLKLRLRSVRKGLPEDLSEVARRFEGVSFADIEMVLVRAVKDMVLRGDDRLEVAHLSAAITRDGARMKHHRSSQDA